METYAHHLHTAPSHGWKHYFNHCSDRKSRLKAIVKSYYLPAGETAEDIFRDWPWNISWNEII